jgi:CBS domain-containing protein
VEAVQSGAPFKEGLPDVKVGEVMRRDVATVHPDSPITQVVELLLDKDFTAVPVVDNDGKVVGMVSDNDLLTHGGMSVTISLKRATDLDYVRELHDSLENPERKVSKVMTREVVTVAPAKQEADQAREAQLARLQAIRMLLWNQASADPIRAAQALMKLEAREARLRGLDMPTKVALTDPDGGIPLETIRRVMERVDRQMVHVMPEPASLLPAIKDDEKLPALIQPSRPGGADAGRCEGQIALWV